MNQSELKEIIYQALQEDLGFGDLSSAIFPEGHLSSGTFLAKANGTLAGLDIIIQTYRLLDDNIKITLAKQDGDVVTSGDVIAKAEGPTRALLSGERVVLNFVQHLSGIATATRKAVNALNSDHTRVCDTRKTLPGLRMLQKYAVRCGGGYNHRYRLDDGIMIKDNHIKAAGSIAKAVEKAKSQHGLMVKVEVETETKEQVLEAIEAGADIIMLDNRPPEEVKQLVTLIPEHIISEASGDITLETIGSYRETGVDYISMGSLTHSVNALDISFNLDT
ncbi:MAG: carboxylating nicotinate-nucleotide diphosphorylase [Balneolaceae bacterium]|nr:carboxylating nicotinate-nucleotide diphosphorylase [Balneolaceae bacterium]